MRFAKGFMFFLAGVVLTAAFFVSTGLVPNALAVDNFACIRQDLHAKMYNGYPPRDKKFTIVYEVPTCYGTQGYKVDWTYIYGGNMVAVTYQEQ